MALWRIDACKAETGDRSNTSIYNAIRAGLFTRPVAIGQRAKAWPPEFDTPSPFCAQHGM